MECTVFGKKVGGFIDIQETGGGGEVFDTEEEGLRGEIKDVSMEEVAKHDHKEDCWVGLHGFAYDLSEFAEEHPPGPESIWELCGKEGTDVFKAVHSEGMLEDFKGEIKGRIAN